MAEFEIENGFRPLDIASLAYIAIQISLVLSFIAGGAGWVFFLIFYSSAAGIALIFAAFPVPKTGIVWKALRIYYPLFLFILFYEAVGPQVFIIFKEPLDRYVAALERLIFGVDPAFAVQPYMEIWLNELMNIAYICGFFLIPTAVVLLSLKRRWAALEKMTLACGIAFYSSYVTFILFPVVGPGFFLSDHYYLPMIGPFFTPIAGEIVDRAAFYGGAMPSSYCAVALVVAIAIMAEFRRFRLFIVAFLTLLCLSMIYGRYQYASSVTAGLVLGLISIKASRIWLNRFAKKQDIRRCVIPCDDTKEILSLSKIGKDNPKRDL